MTFCNTTLEDSTISETPIFSDWTFHRLGLALGASFGLVSIIITFVLIALHATHYSKPWEQRHIIRILLMIPIYSAVSFLSFKYYQHAVYFEVLRDCYEAFAIASFFTLLCHYVAPTLHDQKIYFRTMKPKNWFWGVFFLQKCTGGEHRGPFRKPRSGLTWFNVVYVGVYQYCLIRVLCTITSVITQKLGVYCEASSSPAFAHIWVTAVECLSVTIAMFCLVQFYIQLKDDLAEHRPFLKVLCIKLVIFFSFWQSILISLASSSKGPFQPTEHLAYQDIKVGLPGTLLCIEMAIFAVMHIFAFPWKGYTRVYSDDPLNLPGANGKDNKPKYKGGPLGILAILDAFNIWDIVKASARGFRWLFVGVRKRHEDESYQNPKLNDNTRYEGPSFAHDGEEATELRPNPEQTAPSYPSNLAGKPSVESDRVGLLNPHSPTNARMPSPSPQRPSFNSVSNSNNEYTPGDDSLDLGAGNARARQPVAQSHRRQFSAEEYGAKPSDFNDDDDDPATYHPGIGPAGVHPALRENEVPAPQGGGQWSHWAGATGKPPGGAPGQAF